VLRPEHTKITQEHVASADLILFVTSAERTVSQEEIDLIRFIAEHNKSEVVFIINKIDVFEDSLIDFVDREGMTTLVRFLEQVLARETQIRDPLIFPFPPAAPCGR
jgi:predicted GTPase